MAFRFLSRNLFFKVRSFPRHDFKDLFHRCITLKNAIEIKMPSLSPTMNQGTIIKWYKREGDTIMPGDLLCEIQTDKAVLGFEVEEEGILAKILKGDNSKDISIGTLIAIIAEQGTDWKNIQIPSSTEEKPSSSSVASIQNYLTSPRSHHSDMFGPVVRNLIDQYNINPQQVPHTGPHNILMKSDLLSYIKEKCLKPLGKISLQQQPPQSKASKKVAKGKEFVQMSDYIDVPLSDEKCLKAKQYLLSKNNIPHLYLTTTCSLNALETLCKEFKNQKSSITWMDIFIKAIAISLEKYPNLNALWLNESLKKLDDIKILFAVDNGKMSGPSVIKDAASLTVIEISKIIQNFRSKSNSELINHNSYQTPSFVISFLDDLCGITNYTSLIPHPHVACLSIAAPRVCLNENSVNYNCVDVTLSVNNEVIDYVIGSDFLKCLKDSLQNPSLLISHHSIKINVANLFN